MRQNQSRVAVERRVIEINKIDKIGIFKFRVLRSNGGVVAYLWAAIAWKQIACRGVA